MMESARKQHHLLFEAVQRYVEEGDHCQISYTECPTCPGFPDLVVNMMIGKNNGKVIYCESKRYPDNFRPSQIYWWRRAHQTGIVGIFFIITGHIKYILASNYLEDLLCVYKYKKRCLQFLDNNAVWQTKEVKYNKKIILNLIHSLDCLVHTPRGMNDISNTLKYNIPHSVFNKILRCSETYRSKIIENNEGSHDIRKISIDTREGWRKDTTS